MNIHDAQFEKEEILAQRDAVVGKASKLRKQAQARKGARAIRELDKGGNYTSSVLNNLRSGLKKPNAKNLSRIARLERAKIYAMRREMKSGAPNPRVRKFKQREYDDFDKNATAQQRRLQSKANANKKLMKESKMKKRRL